VAEPGDFASAFTHVGLEIFVTFVFETFGVTGVEVVGVVVSRRAAVRVNAEMADSMMMMAVARVVSSAIKVGIVVKSALEPTATGLRLVTTNAENLSVE
jgi:hypothetical protein